MDNIDNGPTHTISPHGNNSEHFKGISTPDSETDSATHRHCVSLPLYYDQVSSIRFDSIWFQFHFTARCSDVRHTILASHLHTFCHICECECCLCVCVCARACNQHSVLDFVVLLQFNWKTFRVIYLYNPNDVSLANDSLVLDCF